MIFLSFLLGGMHNIQEHTFGLACYTYMLLSSLCHGNRHPVAQIYTEGQFESPSTQGAIVNFNLVDSCGKIIGYSQVHLMNSSDFCITILLLQIFFLVDKSLLSSGGQNGQIVQYSCAHRLFLQHWSLSIFHWDHQ